MEAVPMMNATTSPTGRIVEPITAKQRTADGYLDEIEIPTRMVSLQTCPAHYRNVRINRVVVVAPAQMLANFAKEDDGASSE